MRLTKIYTKIGDKGQTMLAGGSKIAKDSVRVESYGTVDELNGFLGLWRDTLSDENELFDDIISQLLVIQNEMHDLGGELCTPHDILDVEKQQVVCMENVARLEREIDEHNAALPPLANFILPGGHQASSLAHVCRAICRRAERRVLTLAAQEVVRDEPRIYLNRLSDWLFVAGRVVNKRLSCGETIWQQAGKS